MIPREAQRVPRVLANALRGLIAGDMIWPAYIHGSVGTGKTCAGLWMHDHVTGAVLTDVEELAERVFEQEHIVWRAARSASLVIVDEVGSRIRESEREYLGVLRMATIRCMLPIIWISNLAPADMREAFDERVFSRLCCGTIVSVKGPDQRFGEV